MNEYTIEQITKDVLDSIKVGDLVEINDWGRWFEVKAVSENYFVVVTADKTDNKEYSVISKVPFAGKYKDLIDGAFYCGPDYYIFGHPLCAEYDHLYDFDNAEANDAYLKTFEEGKAEISMRQRVSIWYLNIAPCAEETA